MKTINAVCSSGKRVLQILAFTKNLVLYHCEFPDGGRAPYRAMSRKGFEARYPQVRLG